MTGLILYIFSFLLPLGGIVSEILGFKITPLVALFLLILRLFSSKQILFSKSIFIIFICFILLLLIHALRETVALVLVLSFIYYLLIGFIFATFSKQDLLDTFYTGFVHGAFFVSILFFASLFNGGLSNSIIEWQFGIPVNLSGMGNPNGWAPFLILAIAGNDYIWNKKKLHKIPSTVNLIYSLSFLISLAFTFSRAAILSVAVYYLILYRKAFLGRPIVAGGILTLFAITILQMGSFNFDSQEVGSISSNKEGSIQIRADIFNAISTLPWNNIFIGNGYGTSQVLIEERIGYPVSLHNVYLATLVELGVFQFILLFLICVSPFALIYVNRKKIISLNESFHHKYILYGLFASLIFWFFHESHINTAFWATYFCFIQQMSLKKRYD